MIISRVFNQIPLFWCSKKGLKIRFSAAVLFTLNKRTLELLSLVVLAIAIIGMFEQNIKNNFNCCKLLLIHHIPILINEIQYHVIRRITSMENHLNLV